MKIAGSTAGSFQHPPKVSLVCPSFNHGRYVAGFIRSILTQDDERWELVIIDDASSDDNLEQIARFDDPRIRLIGRSRNRGIAAGMNEGVLKARAEIVAFLASDDLAEPAYVGRIISAFASRPDAIAAYVMLDHMDESGITLRRQTALPAGAGRHEMLRNSFYGHNQLPSPGMAMRRDAALSMPVPEGVMQCSDWILQNRILIRGEVVMLREPLVRYRVSRGSLSAPSEGAAAREALEMRVMMDDFLGIRSVAFLGAVFGSAFEPYRHLDPVHMPYALGRLALDSKIHEKRCWGYETIVRHLSLPGMAESLQSATGLSHRNIADLAPPEGGRAEMEVRSLRRRVRRLWRAVAALASLLGASLFLLLR